MQRVILHVDMDAFFAAVEQREHPEFRGKPVIVGADPRAGKGRGVVSTCSYEAREFGVHSAMPISQAWRLCPQGIYVPPNGRLYAQVSLKIFDIFYEFTDLVEPLSIDEAFLDVTGSLRLFGSGPEIAQKIKARIREKEQLSASVGVAPNKYLAKIASDLQKPDGLVVVEAGQVQEFLNPLEIARLWGAGKHMQKRLQQMGIKTIGDLARVPKETLTKKLGNMGGHFYNLAHGIDERLVETAQGIKSISNEHTFAEDLNELRQIRKTLLQLCEKVGFRLRTKKLQGKTIQLKLRYSNFSTITRRKTLPEYTEQTETIFDTAWQLFESNYQKGRAVRLLGVGVSSFGASSGRQLSLFETGQKSSQALDKLEDLLKARFGNKIAVRAEALSRKNSDLK